MSGDRSGRLREIGESIGDAVMRRTGRVSARVQERRGLAADLLESEDAYRVVFDAPGATATDVQVRFVDGGVSVRVDRFREFYEGFDMRFPGRGLSLDGRVELPDPAVVDADRATATLTDRGTLEIDLPKREGAPARTTVDDEPVDDEPVDDEPVDVGGAVEGDDRSDDEQGSAGG